MKHAYKRRPQDFKRRILSRIYTNQQDLLKEEYRWLQMIKPEELHKRYYNLHNHHYGHWSTIEASRMTVGQKISAAPLRAQRIGDANRGRKYSDEYRQWMSNTRKGKPSPKKGKPSGIAAWNKGMKLNPEHRQKLSQSHLGKTQSQETINKRVMSRKDYKHSDETRRKISESHKKRIVENVSTRN